MDNHRYLRNRIYFNVGGAMNIKRYDCYGLDDLGGSYNALSEQCSDGDWCRYEDVKDLSLRIAVAVNWIEKDLRTEHDPSATPLLELLKMPIESLHEFIKNNPQYGEKI